MTVLSTRVAWLIAVLTCGLLAGCADNPCSGCDGPAHTGSVATLELDEASGVVASAALDDVI